MTKLTIQEKNQLSNDFNAHEQNTEIKAIYVNELSNEEINQVRGGHNTTETHQSTDATGRPSSITRFWSLIYFFAT